MPEKFYVQMDKMFEELGIKLKDTNDKEEIKSAENFIATFTPSNQVVIE